MLAVPNAEVGNQSAFRLVPSTKYVEEDDTLKSAFGTL